MLINQNKQRATTNAIPSKWGCQASVRLAAIYILLLINLPVCAQLPWYLLSDATTVDCSTKIEVDKNKTRTIFAAEGISPANLLIDFSSDFAINRHQSGESGKHWETIVSTDEDGVKAKISFHWKSDTQPIENENICVVRGSRSYGSDGKLMQEFEAELPIAEGRKIGKNNIRLEFSNGQLTVFAGNPERVYAGSLEIGSVTEVEIAANSKLKLSDLKLTRSADCPNLSGDAAHCAFSPEGLPQIALNELGEITAKGIGGYWQPLDRETDAKWAIPAERYFLAIAPHSDLLPIIGVDQPFVESRYSAHTGLPAQLHENAPLYDIFAIDGDRGELKGELFATPFADYYELRWLDTSGDPILFDLTASLENDAILTLYFPLWHCTLRFSRSIPSKSFK